MTASPHSNAYTPYRWARVVSGETWAEYAVGPSGLVEAKTTRGPLILWATKTGREARPHLDYVARLVASLPDVPTPSPLEVQAAQVNMQAYKAMQQGDAFIWKSRKEVPPGRFASRHSRAAYRLRAAGLSLCHAASFELLAFIEKATGCGFVATVTEDLVSLIPTLARVYGVLGRLRDQRVLLRKFHQMLKLNYARRIRFLIAADYRAHVTRRVRPPARRVRVRRPLYAQPRPPTAPLAPPVA